MAWGRRKKPKRRGYVRPSRARKKTGWSLRELAELSGVSARTVRSYLQRGVLPRPPFAGSATRYQRRQLLWLCGIRRLLTGEQLTLDAIRARLNALSAPELEVFATGNLPPGKLADALGVRVQQPVSPPPGALVSNAIEPTLPDAARWRRIELALGLELHVREDASAQVLEMARGVRQWCARSMSGA
jgi:DNA-binding transcriptional MerR regulator